MVWVALGHFYMYGVAYAANTQMPILVRNRGECEQVEYYKEQELIFKVLLKNYN